MPRRSIRVLPWSAASARAGAADRGSGPVAGAGTTRVPPPRRRSSRLAALALAATLTAASCSSGPRAEPGSPPPPTPGATPSAAATAAQQLAGLQVVAARPDPSGYDRSCASGRRCVFGPAWSDDVDVAFGHDGCSTRDNILATQLTNVVTRPGSRCVVVAGELLDPYTGQRIPFTKEQAGAVAIDHVVALAAAWDFGAHAWTPARRRDFANDPGNLLATSATVNTAKADHTPAQWRPPTASGRCLYAQRYTATAAAYALPVTPADRAALLDNLAACR